MFFNVHFHVHRVRFARGPAWAPVPGDTEIRVAESLRFGSELRRRRLEAGLSLGALADRVHYSRAHLSRIEIGRSPAPVALARECDIIFDAGGELAVLAPHASVEPRSAARPSPAGEAWVLGLGDEGAEWFQSMPRREALALGAGSFLALNDRGPVRSSAAQDERSAVAFQSMFGQLRRIGQESSPTVVLPTLIAQTGTLRRLASRASGRARDRFLILSARYAEYTGWMSQEAGNDQSALWWTDQAVTMAEAAGDTDLTAYAMIRRSLVALYRRDFVQTVNLARQAQNSSLPPEIREQAMRREAQGHALVGDYDACMRSLDRSRELSTTVDASGGTLALGSTNLPDPAAMVAGWCSYDLGYWSDSAETLDREIARLAPDALRSRARYGVRSAMAHARAGEIDHACTQTGSLLDTVDAVDSATVMGELLSLGRILGRYRNHPPVKLLLPRLNDSLYAAHR